ncbi:MULTISPECIES: hypothetical protein [Micromonospora]|uniref:hypothetical protein n=1 Tax=Micromonospora TaxID=1873 RepID=UPI002FF07698
MTNQSDCLPVLVIDGARFADFGGFVREFSQLLCHGTWNGHLDALTTSFEEASARPTRGGCSGGSTLTGLGSRSVTTRRSDG